MFSTTIDETVLNSLPEKAEVDTNIPGDIKKLIMKLELPGGERRGTGEKISDDGQSSAAHHTTQS